jgi:hypothetical protein
VVIKVGVMDKSCDYWNSGHKRLGFYPKEKHPIFKKEKADSQVEIIRRRRNQFF